MGGFRPVLLYDFSVWYGFNVSLEADLGYSLRWQGLKHRV